MTAAEIVDAEVVEAGSGSEIAVRNQDALTLFGTSNPDEVVSKASKAARSLAKVVEKQRLYTQIGPNKHIRVEGWQLLGSMTGVFAVGEGEPEPVEVFGIPGFKATVVAVRNGDVVGRATAYCMRDEDRWRSQPTHAVASMAQTRATSKALKGPLGFIVKLAGYESTPAEEMPVEPRVQPPPRAPSPPAVENGKPTDRQVQAAVALIRKVTKSGLVDETELAARLQAKYSTADPSEMTASHVGELIDGLAKLVDRAGQS